MKHEWQIGASGSVHASEVPTLLTVIRNRIAHYQSLIAELESVANSVPKEWLNMKADNPVLITLSKVL